MLAPLNVKIFTTRLWVYWYFESEILHKFVQSTGEEKDSFTEEENFTAKGNYALLKWKFFFDGIFVCLIVCCVKWKIHI